MNRLLIVIVVLFLMIAAKMTVAAKHPAPFDPIIHNESNLPVGILYVDSGTVNLVENDRIVVDDAEYPFNKKMEVYRDDGLKLARKNLKKGQKVAVFANAKHEAVYIVLK